METIWKQAFTLSEGETGYWQIGSMELWIERREGCLEIYPRQASESHPTALVVQPQSGRPLPDEPPVARIALPDDAAVLRFAPRSADRPVVVRPSHPFHVLAQSETCLYLSTPLWLSIQLEPSRRLLLELPLYRLSDTWFGPSTREGELCYATRTRASLLPPQPPVPPHRAFTALTLLNRGREPVLLERVNLPAPHLALFQAADGSLWTPSVRLEIDESKSEAALRLGPAPPAHAGPTTRIAAARERSETNLLKRALGALIG